MALKDWKKVQNKKEHLIFNNYNKREQIQVYKYGRIWVFENGKIKRFKTKAQAISYAKSYMRKH